MNLGSPLTPKMNDQLIEGREQAAMRLLSPLQPNPVADSWGTEKPADRLIQMPHWRLHR